MPNTHLTIAMMCYEGLSVLWRALTAPPPPPALICSFCKSSKVSRVCPNCGAADFTMAISDGPIKTVLLKDPVSGMFTTGRGFYIETDDLTMCMDEFSKTFIQPCIAEIVDEMFKAVGKLSPEEAIGFVEMDFPHDVKGWRATDLDIGISVQMSVARVLSLDRTAISFQVKYATTTAPKVKIFNSAELCLA